MSFRPCFLFSKKATWLSRLACRSSFWAVLFIRPPPDNRFRPTGRGLGFCNLIFIVTFAAAKAEYNNSQMFHLMDEAKERGEEIAKAIEKSEPKTAEAG